MFDIKSSYSYYQVGSHSGVTTSRKHVEHLSIYKFNTTLYPYVIEVEKYKNNIYILKFYRRLHKNNRNRYSLMSNEGKCSRIIGTCFSLFLSIHKNNPLASLGFLGAHTIDPIKGYVEPKELTKRFKVYKTALLNYFGEETFTHFEDYKNSVYLAISNKNKSVYDIKNEADMVLSDLLNLD